MLQKVGTEIIQTLNKPLPFCEKVETFMNASTVFIRGFFMHGCSCEIL